MAPAPGPDVPRVRLVLPVSGNHVQDIALMELVDRALRKHPGAYPFEWLLARGKQRVRITPPGMRVAWGPELEAELRALLGAQNVEVVAPPPQPSAPAADSPAAGEPLAPQSDPAPTPPAPGGWADWAPDLAAGGQDHERQADDMEHVRNWWG